MKLTLLTTATFLGLTLAAPNTLLNKRDTFDKCSKYGSNCSVQDQRFCNTSTGKISVCHKFGSDCWIRYTQESCSKRSVDYEAPVEKRDQFNKCAAFGSVCDVDGNQFCDSKTGKMSICHQVGFGSGECWVRYTQTAC